MKSDKDAYTRLESALKRAFRGTKKVEANNHWQQNVMHHVRTVGPLNATTNYSDLLEQFLWRFAPVACVLIVVLAVFIINLGLVPEYEVVKLFVEDPIEFSYVQMFDA